ncbi:hypothetical protein [Methylocystis sp. S23]
MAEPVPCCLSEDLKIFATMIDERYANGETLSDESFAIIVTAFRMFSVEARSLEDELLLLQSRLNAADCRIEALTIPDYLGDHLREAAIRDGERAGRVVDLRAIFRDEQEYNRASRDDGDAA